MDDEVSEIDESTVDIEQKNTNTLDVIDDYDIADDFQIDIGPETALYFQ